MKETSGRATEEECLFQDKQTCNRCHVQKKSSKSQFTSYTDRMSDTNYMLSVWIQETTEQDEASPSGAQATRLPPW